MISTTDKEAIITCARKFHATSVYLFGSSLDETVTSHDIDIGVRGVQPRFFFKLYAELIKQLSKPVDVIDLSDEDVLFNKLVVAKGVNLLA
jgi:predicted nucleotidyltransferase